MFKGRVISIYLAPEKAAPTQPVAAARAMPGWGLEGDRDCKDHGSEPDRAVSLIDTESLTGWRVSTGSRSIPPGLAAPSSRQGRRSTIWSGGNSGWGTCGCAAARCAIHAAP